MDEYDEYCTRMENLPTTIKGFCYHDDDGRCYIVLNAKLTNEVNKESYIHEVAHISKEEMYDAGYTEYKG